MTDVYTGDWSYLRQELVRRTHEPLTNFPFVVYVFLGIVLFGGLGVWVEVLKLILTTQHADLASLVTAINTFFPALIGSTALQLVFAAASRSDKVLIAFALLMFCFFTVTAAVLPLFSVAFPKTVLTISAVCSFLAIWLWWVTNGADPAYRTPTPDAATGGEVTRPLAGDLKGFSV